MPQHPCPCPLTEVASGNDEAEAVMDTSADDARFWSTMWATDAVAKKVNAELAKHSCQPPCQRRHELDTKTVSYSSIVEVLSAPEGLDQSIFPPEKMYRCQTVIQWHLSVACKPAPKQEGHRKGKAVPRAD